MLNHFFLSYSRADSSPLLKRFFEDLSDTIRIELSLLHTQPVGFYEETRYGPASEWSDAAKQALQDSGVMVSLISPAYFHCERAGKEWQIFEDRWRKTLEGGEPQGSLPEDLAHVILPVTWSSWHGPVPRVVNELLVHPNHIHQRQALMTMFKSKGMSHGEYAGFVRALASQIIEMTPAANNLLPLDSLPPMRDVPSAFRLWEAERNGEKPDRNQCKRHVVPCWHPELVKHVAVREEVATESEAEHVNVPNQQEKSAPSSEKKTKSSSYLAYAISRERQVLSHIHELCILTPCHVKPYEDVEQALKDARSNPGRVPDLFIIDLDNETPGQHPIQIFTETGKLPSTTLAISGNFEQYQLPELFGATAILPSLSPPDELLDLIAHCADIGRDRHIYKLKKVRDQKRKQRAVFLSYSGKNESLAKFLSSNLAARGIEAWTMAESQNLGEQLRTEIRKGIREARVFVGLITTEYLDSTYCVAELKSFYDRVMSKPIDEQQLLLIPVFYKDPDTSGNDFVEHEVKSLTSAFISDTDFLNGFSLLMGRIQTFLHNE